MVGAEPDRLTLTQQFALAGQWIAVEIYTPKTQPAKRIAAIGTSAADCIRKLLALGLDPGKFEFRPLKRPL